MRYQDESLEHLAMHCIDRDALLKTRSDASLMRIISWIPLFSFAFACRVPLINAVQKYAEPPLHTSDGMVSNMQT